MTADADTTPATARPGALPLAVVFGALIGLTVCELLIAGMEAGRAARITALAGLLIAKVALVVSFFMRARESGRSAVAVVVSIAFAAAAAVVLMLETVFRASVR